MTTKAKDQTPTETAKDTVDWKHATVRQNCLAEASKVCGSDYEAIVSLADKMYRFVIGEPIELTKPIETSPQAKEWK